MANKPSRANLPDGSIQPRSPRPAIVALGVVAILLVGVAFALSGGGASPQVAWSRLATDDVHSLAFVGDDSSRLLVGHHAGVLSSADGGRTWVPLDVRSDAMSLGAAGDGSIVIAGHEVFAQSRDAGRSWQSIRAQLPSLDIHGFARDPANAQRMWAFLAAGNLWTSADGGQRWERLSEQVIQFPVAVSAQGVTRLYGIAAGVVVRSDDGGREWRVLPSPNLYPVLSLAAAPDGSVLIAGGSGGVAQFTDGAPTWSKLPFSGAVQAVAVARNGQTVGVVDGSTQFFRSDNGGRTWPGP